MLFVSLGKHFAAFTVLSVVVLLEVGPAEGDLEPDSSHVVFAGASLKTHKSIWLSVYDYQLENIWFNYKLIDLKFLKCAYEQP